jgi:predicted SnoaL-like aldol condensation-catalyzing enzyme
MSLSRGKVGQAMRALAWTAAATATLLAGCVTPAKSAEQAAACDGSADANREVVLAFYNEGLIGLKPRAAFDRYMAPGFIEHKPDVPDGSREAAATFLERLIASMPQPRWEVVRTVAERDLVFLHGRFTPAAGAPNYAIADVFRLEHCRIVEHWDVVAGPPNEQKNPNSRF